MISLHPLLFIPAMVILRLLLSLAINGFPAIGVSWSEATKWHHPSMTLTEDRISNLVQTTDDYYTDFNRTLDAILIPRVPGTEGHQKVREFIIDEMKSLKWNVEEDKFTGSTPHGEKQFSNIMSTLNPKACRRLVIACHYDSLYNREYTFLGATDSAVPCTMMIHAAKVLNLLLKEQKQRKDNKLTLQLIFFDGEEAFKKWSKTDSLYGSKHLAAKWNSMHFPDGNNSKHCTETGDYASYLDRMDVMVLLDLIGTANPKFYSYFLDTKSLYMQFVDIEHRLNAMKLIETHPLEDRTNYFDRRSTFALVEDDHIPFMSKGVPIVHLIPSPFPHVWHKESDNRSNLHHPTINNINKILWVFIAQYLHLNIPGSTLVM